MKSGKIHLSLLMFFQICTIGVYSPILSVYLKDYLHFTETKIGVILSMSAYPSILAPFFSAWIVDRFITSRKYLTICQTFAAITIYILSYQKSYNYFLITYLIYTTFLMPTFALVNALVFHNYKDSKSFGFIRVWGTIGWIIAGWAISLIWKFTEGADNMPYALRLSSLFSLAVVILTLMLPKLKLHKDEKITLIPKETIAVIIKPEVILILIAVFISACADKFYFYGTPIFLQDNGVKKDNILFALSLGQIPEIIMLFTLAGLLKKIKFKTIFSLALILQIVRFIIFWVNGPLPLTLLGISLNGFIYALFYAASTIYLDTFTDEKSRGGTHQIFSLITVGLAGLLANLAAGWVAENYKVGELINFKAFWLFPTAASVLALIIIRSFMENKK